MSKKDVSKLKYEQAVEQLEGIIDQIESGDIGLEASLDQYEQGMKLILHCRQVLNRAEEKMKTLQAEASELDSSPQGNDVPDDDVAPF